MVPFAGGWNASRPILIFSIFLSRRQMPDHRHSAPSEAVHLTVADLPRDVARQLREAERQDPDFVKRVLLYGVVHRTVFETLSGHWRG